MGQDPTGEDPLIATLRAIADEDSAVGPSPDIEFNLRSAVRAIAKGRTRRRYAVALVVAATLLIAILLPGERTAPSPPPQRSTPVEVATEFLPLMYGGVPMSESRIVRLEVPQTVLVTFGLSTVDMAPSSSETVLAEVVVGEDGLARAVRFVQRHTQETMP
jgi:hypothetical protein